VSITPLQRPASYKGDHSDMTADCYWNT